MPGFLPKRWSLLLAILAAFSLPIYGWMKLDLPFFSWFYPKFSDSIQSWNTGKWIAILFTLYGVAGVILGPIRIELNPTTKLRWQRFKMMKRGWYSFLIFGALIFLASMDQMVVGHRALVVKYQNEWYFPAFKQESYSGKAFGFQEDSEVNYRQLQNELEKTQKGWVLMPLVPWASTSDTDDTMRNPLEMVETHESPSGFLLRREDASESEYFSGMAYRFYVDQPTQKAVSARLRKGLFDGTREYFARNGDPLGSEEYEGGILVSSDQQPADWNESHLTPWQTVFYPPLPPSIASKHYLGTDSRGWDVLAQLFGGWQVNLKAALLFLTVTFTLGILIGTILGYFGGWTDILGQRFVEILQNMPFLYIVIFLSALIGRENINVPMMIGIVCIFSWISLTYYLRASTLKEKARDYVSAAQLMGASTPRILLKHILPNAISTVVTFLPFEFIAIVNSLTALSYLGFGLPDSYPLWGVLLDDGTTHLTSPWIVSSVFATIVFVLLLISFIGEALREAFDPRRFTTYR